MLLVDLTIYFPRALHALTLVLSMENENLLDYNRLDRLLTKGFACPDIGLEYAAQLLHRLVVLQHVHVLARLSNRVSQ